MAGVLERKAGLDKEEASLVSSMIDAYNKRLARLRETGYTGAIPEKMSRNAAAEIINNEGIATFIAITSTERKLSEIRGIKIQGYEITEKTKAYEFSAKTMATVEARKAELLQRQSHTDDIRADVAVLKQATQVQREVIKTSTSTEVREQAAKALLDIKKQMGRLNRELQLAAQPIDSVYLRGQDVSPLRMAKEIARAQHGYSLNVDVMLRNLEQELREVGGTDTAFTERSLGIVKALLNLPEAAGKITEQDIEDLFKDITVQVYLPNSFQDEETIEQYNTHASAMSDMNEVMISFMEDTLGWSRQQAERFLRSRTVDEATAQVHEQFNAYTSLPAYSKKDEPAMEWW